MKKFKSLIKNLHEDESGQGMIEYILILAGVIGMAIFAKGQFEKWQGEAADKAQSQLSDF